MPRPRPSSNAGLGASGPHHFVEPEDVRAGLAMSVNKGGGLQMSGPVALADASLRDARCAVPGCGKPRKDQAHWPTE